jgi:hypothetical protein
MTPIGGRLLVVLRTVVIDGGGVAQRQRQPRLMFSGEEFLVVVCLRGSRF